MQWSWFLTYLQLPHLVSRKVGRSNPLNFQFNVQVLFCLCQCHNFWGIQCIHDSWLGKDKVLLNCSSCLKLLWKSVLPQNYIFLNPYATEIDMYKSIWGGFCFCSEVWHFYATEIDMYKSIWGGFCFCSEVWHFPLHLHQAFQSLGYYAWGIK